MGTVKIVILTAYITGFIVSLLYDMTLKLSGHDPYGGKKGLIVFIDIVLWPISVPGAFILAVILNELKMKAQWQLNCIRWFLAKNKPNGEDKT